MIDIVTGLFEMKQYNDKKAMRTVNLVETKGLVQYTWPLEITYEPGKEFLGHEFKSGLIEQEYGIKTKSASSENPQENATIEKFINY